MTKLVVVACLAFALGGVASAQPSAADRAPEPAAAEPVPPPETQPTQPAPPPAPDADALRKTCTDAMNANPDFAKSIIATVDKQIDAKTIAAHVDAANHIAENERHVLLSYAAMWLIAAGFVIFLWRRQQALKSEIAQLRKDLDAAGKS